MILRVAALVILAVFLSCEAPSTPPPAPTRISPTAPVVAPAAPAPPAPTQHELRWKIPVGEVVAYAIEQRDVGSAKAASFDLDAMAEAQGATKAQRRRMKKTVGATAELPRAKSTRMVLLLEGKGPDRIDARLVVTRIELASPPRTKMGKQFAKAFKSMEGKVQLRCTMDARGFVDGTGTAAQRNLVAMITELPYRTVAVGDAWKHSVNLVKISGPFVSEKTEGTNEVKLESIDGDVARISWKVSESVQGKMLPPQREPIPAAMASGFSGTGEFAIAEGRWRRIDHRFHLVATGHLQADSTDEIIIVPLAEIPPEVLAAK